MHTSFIPPSNWWACVLSSRAGSHQRFSHYFIFTTLLPGDDALKVMIIESQEILISFIKKKKSGGQASLRRWTLMNHASLYSCLCIVLFIYSLGWTFDSLWSTKFSRSDGVLVLGISLIEAWKLLLLCFLGALCHNLRSLLKQPFGMTTQRGHMEIKKS